MEQVFKHLLRIWTITLLATLFTIPGCGSSNGIDTDANNSSNSSSSKSQKSAFIVSADFDWTMINVDDASQQGDAHLIQVKNGKTILIDTGFSTTAERDLISYLKANAISKIDMVFITHPHSDHYGGLLPLIADNIQINSVYFNVPTPDRCNTEPWGCNPTDIAAIVQTLSEKNIPLYPAIAGMTFNLGPDTLLNIVYAFNTTNSPVSDISLNDESLIIQLQYKTFRFLLTGDLDLTIGTYLAENAQGLQADVLKIPHHGASSLAPDSFFDMVNPRYALVPAPKTLWCSDRDVQVRDWVTKQGVPVYVNGFHGDIHVLATNGTLMIVPEYDPSSSNLCQ